MSELQFIYTMDDVTFQLQEAYNFDWVAKLGRVFRVFDQQDSGNICFGVEKEEKKYFVKFAGAKPMDFKGNPGEAIDRLIQGIPLYNTLKHPALIQIVSHFQVEAGYAVVFDWFDGECLHSHWSFAGAAKYSHPDSPFFRYKSLPVHKRLDSLDAIYSFHEYAEAKGYVAVDFYDGSILYDFAADTTKICDIDFYRQRPAVNDMGENFWGSKRFKSPEEFVLDAPIDEKTNVFHMGAAAFVVLGGELDRSSLKWEGGPALHEVALRAVHPDRNLRYTNVAAFKSAWDQARVSTHNPIHTKEEIRMFDVFEVATALVDHVREKYPNDIAVIAYYGSYAQGTATKRSDLDFFFIPATSAGYSASLQFVLDGISFDFWPISWERAEKMASFDDPFTTIINDSRLLYVRSDEDRIRFMKLRDTISAMQEPGHAREMAEKAEAQLSNAYVHLYKMGCSSSVGNLLFYRTEAFEVLTEVLQGLVLLNQTYLTKGWGKNMEQILQLPLKPPSLEPLLHLAMHSNLPAEICSACEQLTADILELILVQKEKHSGAAAYPERMKGFYEEAKGTLDKIITACEMNDYPTAFFASVNIQDQIAQFLFFAENGYWAGQLHPGSSYQDLYLRLGFPDLTLLLDPRDLTKLQAAVEGLIPLLESHLRTQGVEIHSFQDMEQFEIFLKNQ